MQLGLRYRPKSALTHYWNIHKNGIEIFENLFLNEVFSARTINRSVN